MYNNTYTLCKCTCGKFIIVMLTYLKNNNTKSCGCLQKEKVSVLNKTHGLSYKHPLYEVWKSMKGRCYTLSNRQYIDYGGRGIFICAEWLNDFQKFYNWSIENGWQKSLTIDRKNNDGPYSPGNCRYVSNKIQALNKRTSRYLTIFNETKTVTEWTQDSRCIVKERTFWSRINKNWNLEEALTTLPKKDLR